MSAAELLDNLNRAGATMEIVDGKPRVRGAQISDSLMAALRANRAEVLAEIERRKTGDRDRYGRVPPMSAPTLAKEVKIPEQWKQAVFAYVLRQPRPVHSWAMARSNLYFDLGVPNEDCEWRACIDLIAWQRMRGAREAAQFVLDLPTDEELPARITESMPDLPHAQPPR